MVMTRAPDVYAFDGLPPTCVNFNNLAESKNLIVGYYTSTRKLAVDLVLTEYDRCAVSSRII